MSDPVVLLSTGDVVGPAGGVTDNSMVLFSGTSGKLIKGNNAVVTAAGLALLDDVNAAAQRVTLGLGTAATATLTTSATDTTAGRVMKVGDFGLGLDAVAVADANTIPASGVYRLEGGSGVNGPLPNTFFTLVNYRYGTTSGAQIATWMGVTTGRTWVRAQQSNVWGAWRELALTDSPAFTGTPTAPTASAGTNTTQLATTAFVQASTPLNLKTSGIAGSFSNLKVSATGTNATVTVTADAICLKNASNEQVVLNAVSVAPSLATSGANGLDTGASVVSTWYYVWVIWEGTTTAGLLSLSATAPTMPSGYTHKARVGAVRTDGTANKYPLSYTQFGNSAHYKVAAGSNVTATPMMASGAVTWPATVAAVAFVPPTASHIKLSTYLLAVSTAAYVAPNAAYSLADCPILQINSSYGGTFSAPVPLLLESTNIYYGSSANTKLLCFGWEDNL